MKKLNRSLLVSLSIAAATFTTSITPTHAISYEALSINYPSTRAHNLSFYTYKQETPSYILNATLPFFNDTLNNDYTTLFNEIVQNNTTDIVSQAVDRAESYHETFMTNTEKTTDFVPTSIDIDYNVYYDYEGILSFSITQTEKTNYQLKEKIFYNINLNTNEVITLENLLGPDYIDIINNTILTKMEQLELEAGDDYFFHFSGIKEDQDFYINAYGNPVIVFDTHEIAPSTMGLQEFEITLEDTPFTSTAHYTIKHNILPHSPTVNYPTLSGYKGELIQTYINQSLYSIVERYSTDPYSNLILDYEIKRMDDEILSILFSGFVDLDSIGTIPFTHAINIDMNGYGEEIGFDNLFKCDKDSQDKLYKLLNDKAHELGLSSFEGENPELFFHDNRITIFYVPLDDSATTPIYLTLALDEVKDLMNTTFDSPYSS